MSGRICIEERRFGKHQPAWETTKHGSRMTIFASTQTRRTRSTRIGTTISTCVELVNINASERLSMATLRRRANIAPGAGPSYYV